MFVPGTRTQEFLENTGWEKDTLPLLKLYGVIDHRIDSDEVLPGYSSAPVEVNDNGDEFDAIMIAGSVGINCTSWGDELEGSVGLDTVSA